MLLLQLLPMIGMVKRQVLTGKQLQATILMTDTVLKLARIKRPQTDTTSMTNMDKRQEAIKRHLLGIIPMIGMDRKLVVTRQILMA